jgi:hypothetical protein
MKQIQIAILALFCMNFTLHAERIYVNANATGIKNGASWQNAFTDVQEAIKKANSGDEIWVAKGMYFPTT